MSYRREGDTVTITLTVDQSESLMLVLGFALGRALSQPILRPESILRLTNAINEGNPNWTPYKVDEP
jgi:hypothetical protein